MNDKIEWVMVPREADDAMEAAAEDYYEGSGTPFPDWKAAYAAMLAAAPKPEAQAAGLPWLLRERAQVAGVVTGELLNRAADALEAISTPASHDAQQPPAFQRWSMTKGSDGARWSVYMDHDPCGEWVKWAEVQQHCFGIVLAQQPAVVGDGVREVLESADRAIELANRLCAAGPKASHVSCSETHEIAEFVHEAVAALAALTPAATPTAQKEGNGNG